MTKVFVTGATGMEKEVFKILALLKKECHEIVIDQNTNLVPISDKEGHLFEKEILRTSMFVEDLEQDKKKNDLVFQIYNLPMLNLPKKIPKLKVYCDEDRWNCYGKIIQNVDDYLPYKKLKYKYGAMILKKSETLPQWDTLDIYHKKEFKQLCEIFKRNNIKKEKYWNTYESFSVKFLGHKNPISHVGGNITDEVWTPFKEEEKYNFLMQLDAIRWGNNNIIYIFQNKKDPNDIRVEVRQT